MCFVLCVPRSYLAKDTSGHTVTQQVLGDHRSLLDRVLLYVCMVGGRTGQGRGSKDRMDRQGSKDEFEIKKSNLQ